MKECPTFHIVHAGMQKTASKTLTASLEILGFKVSDVPELLENNINVWYDHLVKNEKSIQDVIKSYNQDHFHACVDLPGNAHWRELYQNMDYCKVILTIRDNEEIWYSSFFKFFKLMPRLYGLPGGRGFLT